MTPKPVRRDLAARLGPPHDRVVDAFGGGAAHGHLVVVPHGGNPGGGGEQPGHEVLHAPVAGVAGDGSPPVGQGGSGEGRAVRVVPVSAAS